MGELCAAHHITRILLLHREELEATMKGVDRWHEAWYVRWDSRPCSGFAATLHEAHGQAVMHARNVTATSLQGPLSQLQDTNHRARQCAENRRVNDLQAGCPFRNSREPDGSHV